MSFALRNLALLALLLGSIAYATDIPPRLENTRAVDPDRAVYFWESTSVGRTAQLLTLVCRPCSDSNIGNTESKAARPLVSVLRDTLGDETPENDRVAYVWLLSAPHLGMRQRMLSAVPFFYWRVGRGSTRVTARDLAPQINLTSPQNPVLSGFARQVVQWTALDPLTMWARASSRSYRSNELDNSRFHLEETITYLRHARASNNQVGLTETQLKTIIARLELRKSLLGGLIEDKRAARFADQSAFDEERIRSRNWEVLRQCAEKTGLYFESIDLAGAKGQYGMLWYRAGDHPRSRGTSSKPIWKLLNIEDPWSDPRLQNWKGLSFDRTVDDAGRLLGPDEIGTGTVKLIPLGFYSLNYPKLPLLLVDFRDKLHVRRREMTQRSINEITAGVIGISRITNWYYYAGAMMYNFVSSRHGAAVSQSQRLDCYSQFRVHLSLDHKLDERLYQELERRADSLTVSPLDTAARNSALVAQARYALLQSQTEDGGMLMARVNRDRRAELATFGQSMPSSLAHGVLHLMSFGLYTQRVGKQHLNLIRLDEERRFESNLDFLDTVVANGTQPEVAFRSDQIRSSVSSLRQLLGAVKSPSMRAHATGTLERIAALSRDEEILAECRQTSVAMNAKPDQVNGTGQSVSTKPTASGLVSGLQ